MGLAFYILIKNLVLGAFGQTTDVFFLAQRQVEQTD